ncbi:MAG: transporter [Verrucomicrobiota bacterium]
MFRCLLLLASLAMAPVSFGQDLQPRRWTHVPVGSTFTGATYAYTDADIYLNPSLRVEDATLDIHTLGVSVVHSFKLLDKSARFDLIQTFKDGRWKGLLNGSEASTSRSGMGDTALRFSINLLGAPPLSGEEFVDYRKSKADCETIVGAGLVVVLPTGNYLKDRRLNLGGNRYTFRPQIGVVHNRGKWSYELTASGWFFSDNDSFVNGSTLEQDSLFSLQSHVVYTFRPGLWLAAGAAYGTGGRTQINGAKNDDGRNNLLWGVSFGFPASRSTGFRLSYINTRTLERTGFDSHSVLFGVSRMW